MKKDCQKRNEGENGRMFTWTSSSNCGLIINCSYIRSMILLASVRARWTFRHLLNVAKNACLRASARFPVDVNLFTRVWLLVLRQIISVHADMSPCSKESVNLSLCPPWRRMGRRVVRPFILNTDTRCSRCIVFPCPGRNAPVIHWIGGWVFPQGLFGYLGE